MQKKYQYILVASLIGLIFIGITIQNFFMTRYFVRRYYPNVDFVFEWSPFGMKVLPEDTEVMSAFQMTITCTINSSTSNSDDFVDPDFEIEIWGNIYWLMYFITLQNYHEYFSYNWTITLDVLDTSYFANYDYYIFIYRYEAEESDPQLTLLGIFDDFIDNIPDPDYHWEWTFGYMSEGVLIQILAEPV